MYCPPESGNMEPSSAKATQAHSEITPPRTHTRKNSFGFGKGPAISLAVRKIEEPMMPLTSSSTESSRPSPRTRLGFCGVVSASGAREAGAVFMSSRLVFHPQIKSLVVSRSQSVGRCSLFADRTHRPCIWGLPTTNDRRLTTALSHAQFIGRFQRGSAAAADDGRAIATGQRIADFRGADRAVENHCGFPCIWRCFWSDFHKHETVTQFSDALAAIPRHVPSFARLDSRGGCPYVSFIRAASAGSGRQRLAAARW